MTPGEIPQELLDILDRAAGKTHSREGVVAQTLAEILTAYDRIGADGAAGGRRPVTATRKGTRQYNADAAAVHTAGVTTAAAVVDGIGNSPEIAACSLLLAEVAARVGARRGSLVGILAAAELVADRDAAAVEPDAVAVLAVAVPEHTGVAWVGDCRAWGWDGATLTQWTTDHTVGQQLRVNGAPLDLAEAHDNWIRTSLGRAVVATVYQVTIPSDALVLLTSDGVHDALTRDELATLVRAHGDDPQVMADAIVAAVVEDDDGYRDDATVVVIPAREDAS